MKNFRQICFLINAALLFLATGRAQAGKAINSAAEEAVRLALAANPELAAARMTLAEAEARTLSNGRLPNPELSGEMAAKNNFEGRMSVGLTQRFPLAGRLRFERHLSAIELEMARLELKNHEHRFAVETRNAFHELVAARENLLLSRRHAEAATNFARTLAQSAREGLTPTLDAREAELEAEIARLEIETRQHEQAAALARLNSLLGRAATTPFSTPEQLELPKSLPIERSIGLRADLQLAELIAKAGAMQVSLAKAKRWEDIGIGVFVEGERFRDENEAVQPEGVLGVQVSIPLPLWQNGSGKVAEMQAAQSRLQKTAEALRFRAQNEVLAARAKLIARLRVASQIEAALVPGARRQIAETETAYARGETDVQAVFRARKHLAEIESADLEARKNYFSALTEWLAALGEPLTAK